MEPVLSDELISSSGLPETEHVTGGVLVLRTVDMESGQVRLRVGSTGDTDAVTKVGLLTLALDWTRFG